MCVGGTLLHGKLLGDLLQRPALGLWDEEDDEDQQNEAHHSVAEDYVGQANLLYRARAVGSGRVVLTHNPELLLVTKSSDYSGLLAFTVLEINSQWSN